MSGKKGNTSIYQNESGQMIATSTEGNLPNGGLVGESPKNPLIIFDSGHSGLGIIVIYPDVFFNKSCALKELKWLDRTRQFDYYKVGNGGFIFGILEGELHAN